MQQAATELKSAKGTFMISHPLGISPTLCAAAASARSNPEWKYAEVERLNGRRAGKYKLEPWQNNLLPDFSNAQL